MTQDRRSHSQVFPDVRRIARTTSASIQRSVLGTGPSAREAWYLRFGLNKPFGALAQLGERRLCKPEVAGSIPARSTR